MNNGKFLGLKTALFYCEIGQNRLMKGPMKVIDLNADLGEADNADWAQAEYAMLAYVSSANIACGGHAGTPKSMRHMVRGANKYGVAIGAHPSYPDKVHFGRRSKELGKEISKDTLSASLMQQIATLAEIAAEEGSFVAYVKPHGALYNDAVNDRTKADIIASTIAQIDSKLSVMGPPAGALRAAAKDYGLSYIAEGFIDRRYMPNGQLQPRSEDGALISSRQARLVQAKKIASLGTVTASNGQDIPLKVKTLCLHGDSRGAVETARLVRREIQACGISIKAHTHAL